MEKKVQIPTKDNHIIYGTLNWQKPKSNKLIIFVHGLTCSQNDHLYHNGAKFFPKNNFTTFRFNLYDYEEKGRILHECSIKTHSSDIETIVEYFQGKYKEIHIAGHSLGGPSIIYSSQKVNSVILWDPSLVLDKSKQDYWEFDSNKDLYILKGNFDVLASKELHDEWANSGESMLKKMKVPTKIICAQNGPLVDRWKTVINKIPVKYEFKIIKKAGHSFDEEGTEEELFEETLKWIKK